MFVGAPRQGLPLPNFGGQIFPCSKGIGKKPKRSVGKVEPSELRPRMAPYGAERPKKKKVLTCQTAAKYDSYVHVDAEGPRNQLKSRAQERHGEK